MGALAGGVSGQSGHHHYIVTEDLYPLMREWAKRFGFTVPDQRWFAMNHKLLRQAIENTLASTERVVIVDSMPYSYVLTELQQIIYELHSQLEIDLGCVISLDRVYGLELSCPHFLLEVNRLTDLNTSGVDHTSRPSMPSIDEQIQNFVHQITSYHIIVVDDGIWTGDSMRWILNRLQNVGLVVEAVVVGVHVKQSGHQVDHSIPAGKVRAVQIYTNTRPVLDWVCERDFFVGTPLGGRTIADHKHDSGLRDWQSAGAFYSTNEAWLKDWASINSNPRQFMNFCIDRSIAIFAEIGELSRQPVLMHHLERLPIQAIDEAVPLNTPVCKYLKELLV